MFGERGGAILYHRALVSFQDDYVATLLERTRTQLYMSFFSSSLNASSSSLSLSFSAKVGGASFLNGARRSSSSRLYNKQSRSLLPIVDVFTTKSHFGRDDDENTFTTPGGVFKKNNAKTFLTTPHSRRQNNNNRDGSWNDTSNSTPRTIRTSIERWMRSKRSAKNSRRSTRGN